MIEIAPDLYVGNQANYEALGLTHVECKLDREWAVVHACKEPHHREMLRYTGKAAPKDHPEYLFGYRGNRLILNLVDVDDPKFVAPELVDAAMSFIRENLRAGRKVLIHCNQGRSRSPVLAMLFLAPLMGGDGSFEDGEDRFRILYPHYDPARGMREYAKANWARYRLPLAA